MLDERKYYPTIKNYIQKQFNCLEVKTGRGGRGYLGLGLADVLGVYDTSSDFHSDVEVIVVEVKTSTSSFGKSLGQSLGYSIYGERCYLAVTFKNGNGFTEEEKYFADHLGVGLIEVPTKKDGDPIESNIKVKLSSKKHEPIHSLKNYIINKLGISQCSLCNIFGYKDDMIKIKRDIEQSSMFSSNKSRKVFICEDCFETMLPKRYKDEINNKKEAARKAIETMKNKGGE